MGPLFILRRPAVAAFCFLAIVLSFRAPVALSQVSSHPGTTQRQAVASRSSQPDNPPIVRWPVKKALQRLYPDRVVVLDPTFDKLPDTRWGLTVTYSGRKLEALDAVTGRAVWPQPVACPAEPTLLGISGTRYIFMTHYRIFALAGSSGAIAWQVGEEPADDPNLDPESISSWTDRVMTADRLYVVSNTGELVCIDLREGSVLWRCSTEKRISNVLTADDRYAYYVTRQDEGSEINVLDAESGVRARVIPMHSDDPVQALRTVSEGCLVAVLGRRVIGIDVVKGKNVWYLQFDDPCYLSALQSDETGFLIVWSSGWVYRGGLVGGRREDDLTFRCKKKFDQVWTTLSAEGFYIASDAALMAFDAGPLPSADRSPATSRPMSRPRWQVENVDAFTRWPPLLTADDILTITIENKPGTTTTSSQPASAQPESASRYRVRAWDRRSGTESRITPDGYLLTEPVKSFGGLHVRDHCLIVLDGDRLIGYVEGK
jgi:hypothetical protein